MKKTLVFAFLFSFFLFGFSEGTSRALSGSDFDPSRIIDDSIFFNSSGMSVDTIQAFLNSKVPVCDTYRTSTNPDYQPPFICLKDYRQDVPTKAAEEGLCNGISAGNKSSAEIIFEVSQSCGVSAKSLIVLLEKEQSLVTDTWPWSIQYRSATGYGCPDTAPCDSEYYGFFNQVYNAARQFKRYAKDESLFRYRAYRTNYIQYNPSIDCGGTNVTIQNQATAGLYNYTPYQPNPSALANLYGSGDGCSAYGNRNFWRLHNDWFGPTTGEGFSLMTSFNDNGDTRQWVVYKGIKRHVPSQEILRAWRLDQIPLTQAPGLYLGAIPTSEQPLDRLMRPSGSLDVYFVDNGRAYRIPGSNVFSVWGLNPAAIVDVSEDLARLPANQGNISYSVGTASTANIYLMDGGVLRHIQNPQTKAALNGAGSKVTQISDDYFNKTAKSTSISSPRVIDSTGKEYLVSNNKKHYINPQLGAIIPFSSALLSDSSVNRMSTGSNMSLFIRAEGDQKVYLLDSQKHHVTSPEVLSAWRPSSGLGSDTTVLINDILSLIGNGANISDYYMSNSSNNYLVDRNKRFIPSNLSQAYTTGRSIFAASAALTNLYLNGSNVTNFVKSKNSPQTFLLTNSASKRYIGSPQLLNLWAGGQYVTSMEGDNLNRYNTGTDVGAYVSDGSTEYILNGGTKAPLPGGIKANWNLGTPISITDGTLNNFAVSGDIEDRLKSTDGKYYLVKDGFAYLTTDINIANAWALDGAKTYNSNLVPQLLKLKMLTRFVKSSVEGDSRQFVVDGGVLYHLSPGHAQNLGVGSNVLTAINPSASLSPISPWSAVVVKDSANRAYVIDSGSKRHLPEGVIRDFWTNGGSIPVAQSTNGFLNLLPNGINMERVIKSSSPNIYAAQNSTKRWIRSWESYVNYYAPYTTVSESLLNVMSAGSDIQ